MQEDGRTVKLVIGRRDVAPAWDPDGEGDPII